MDYHYSNQYYYYYPSDHLNYHVDSPPPPPPPPPPPYHFSHDFNPSYCSPYNSFPSYDHSPPQFTSSYYVSGFGDSSESIFIDPAGDATRFVVSYSVSCEFNEPEFKEYDPTPYAGGYDPSATYGVPLAPSDEICYPRSTKGGTITVLQVPSGEADKIPRDDQGGQEATPVIQAPPLGNTDNDPKERGSAGGTEDSTGDDSSEGESPEHVPYQTSTVVPGCGLDAVDICDGIFGYYWPCWEREVNRRIDGEMGNHNPPHRRHRRHEGGYCAGGKSSQTQDWQIRAGEYLFGRSNPYDDDDDDDHTKHGVNASVYSGYWL